MDFLYFYKDFLYFPLIFAYFRIFSKKYLYFRVFYTGIVIFSYIFIRISYIFLCFSYIFLYFPKEISIFSYIFHSNSLDRKKKNKTLWIEMFFLLISMEIWVLLPTNVARFQRPKCQEALSIYYLVFTTKPIHMSLQN